MSNWCLFRTYTYWIQNRGDWSKTTFGSARKRHSFVRKFTTALFLILDSNCIYKKCAPFLFQSLRSLLGEELAEFLESEERERRLDAVRSRLRLLRDLRVDTRARGMWARLLNDQPAPRRHKSGNKKGGSASRSGCFGHKMDRIGTISGMGC